MAEMKNLSEVAIKNNQLFGLDYPSDQAKIVALNVPWDVTTSYRAGTVNGPQSILEASYQLDLVSPFVAQAWNLPLWTAPLRQDWAELSRQWREISSQYIQFLESGGDISQDPIKANHLQLINKACLDLADQVTQTVSTYLDNQQAVLTLGGDHAISYGPIKAHSHKYPNLSILHFDAHADLRQAYEDFTHSHASIMYNVMEDLNIHHLVQVGIRDLSPVEMEYSQGHPKITTHLDWSMKNRLAANESWQSLCQEIIKPLSNEVYISFDIDGLDPKLCPNTGTPVPGGLELWQVQYLIETLLKSGRKIVGADLVEVAPNQLNPQDQWDGNVGARCAFLLACAIAYSHGYLGGF